MVALSLRNVEKQYGKQTVLKDCSLEIEDGAFVVLVGPSGSGKTTLLRIVAGLEDLTSGEVYFGDRCVNGIDVGDRDIAMVFQNYGLYPHMTVYNNIAFGLRRLGLPKDDVDRKVREVGRLLGLDPLLKRRPKQLSGGQRQRVALGRAIVREPAVFLLDEPLSNLDAHLRVQMRAEILRVHRSVTATAMYVTHDQVEALTMGDLVVVMNEGRVQQVGTPDELYDRPVNTFVAGFIGTPAMGFLTCRLTRYGDVAALESDGVRLCLPPARAATLPVRDGERVKVGIRPERLLSVESATEDARIAGMTEVVEPLGSEQYVIMDVGGERITSKMPRDRSVVINRKLVFTTDTNCLHLFDAESGARLP